ncbi:MazG nucleotide pyrophosphohydrolase domain-containing protein [Rothia nasimurium]|uniref:MazG nucleotide pyrophosphohydrolase domain-containing protein n=1 Tax=Rothia nasimurium TaxID=85336 RepID=UPI001F2BE9FA|nr:MazG nucleotide pyrophosphohydrolase domain-containing protein [Rothia nasimurium]
MHQENLGQDKLPAGQGLEYLLELFATLRNPGGCAWTAAQTHASIMHYLVEETYEVIEAVEAAGGVDLPLLKEELGDVLLNVIFHAHLASEVPAEQGGFDLADVMEGLAKKLIRRNPHVFGAGGAAGQLSAQDIYDTWDAIKQAEKPERTGVLDGIPPGLPALASAAALQSKLAKAGEGPRAEGQDAPGPVPPFTSEEELGAYLYQVVASARSAGLDAERALRAYNRGVIEAFDS